jgi:hypothetical protein
MINPASQTLKILASYLIAGSFIVPLVVIESPLRYVWFLASAVGLVFAVRFSLIPRRCGHGFITSWGIFFFPFVINPCPVCGDDMSSVIPNDKLGR